MEGIVSTPIVAPLDRDQFAANAATPCRSGRSGGRFLLAVVHQHAVAIAHAHFHRDAVADAAGHYAEVLELGQQALRLLVVGQRFGQLQRHRDVLHAQAADVREASRRELIEIGARKEVLMMLPVVFVVLPIVIVFAFFPGLVGLRLVV